MRLNSETNSEKSYHSFSNSRTFKTEVPEDQYGTATVRRTARSNTALKKYHKKSKSFVKQPEGPGTFNN